MTSPKKQAKSKAATKPAREKVCPSCDKSYRFTSVEEWKPYPFCSERCRLIDLGAWLEEKYQIADDNPGELYGADELGELPGEEVDED